MDVTGSITKSYPLPIIPVETGERVVEKYNRSSNLAIVGPRELVEEFCDDAWVHCYRFGNSKKNLLPGIYWTCSQEGMSPTLKTLTGSKPTG